MAENASLSDYLFEFRRRAVPQRLGMAIAGGVLLAGGGLTLWPRHAWMTGLGLAVAGTCTWARFGQLADALLEAGFVAEDAASGRRLRAAGGIGLAVGAMGVLLVLYSLATRFLHGATGL